MPPVDAQRFQSNCQDIDEESTNSLAMMCVDDFQRDLSRQDAAVQRYNGVARHAHNNVGVPCDPRAAGSVVDVGEAPPGWT
jgi:hypothetical protein